MSYICSGNGKEYTGKPWMTLTMDRWDDLNGPVTFSSYLEYRYNLNKLPKQHFDLIENKEDFNHIRPIVVQPQVEPRFEFLTETEINLMTNEQYEQYKLDYEEECLLNQIRSDIHQEGIDNDAYTQFIEEDYHSEEDSTSVDDY